MHNKCVYQLISFVEPLLRNGNIKAAGQQYVDKSRIKANSGVLYKYFIDSVAHGKQEKGIS